MPCGRTWASSLLERHPDEGLKSSWPRLIISTRYRRVLTQSPLISRGHRVLVAANYSLKEDIQMMNKIRPLHDRVVVKRLDAENKSAGGIVIPDTAGEKPDQGEIVAVGNGKVLEDGKVRPLDVKVGDRILFGKYSGQAVKVEGTEYLVMREDDIMGVVATK